MNELKDLVYPLKLLLWLACLNQAIDAYSFVIEAVIAYRVNTRQAEKTIVTSLRVTP